ncbi:AvrE-family type 3 secretion system effector [Pseudomonas benzopyrenica]|uniref:AvrE-family type 3 secretion system effector n=1 Tax=Pseudomonas benzopyrenica TaxID=2993566 RepID=UPI0039C20CD2
MRLNGLFAGGTSRAEGSNGAAATGAVRQQRRGRGILGSVRSLFQRGQTAAASAIALGQVSGERGVQLNEGRLDLGGNGASERLFEARLNQPHKRFGGLQQDRRGHRFADEAGRAFHFQRTAGAQAVLKASLATSPELAPPGPAHIGLICGVQTDAEGRQERLMNGVRYRFDHATQRWQPHNDSRPYERLVRLGDGRLQGIPRHGNLRDVSVAPGGANARLLLDSQHRKVELSDADGRLRSARLHTTDGRGQRNLLAERIGLGPGDRLYATDRQGDLYVQDDHQEQEGTLLLRRVEQDRLQQALGGAVRLQSFLHDDDGHLTAVVRDRNDQLHACPLGDNHQFQPGWNLSDALVTTQEAGLPLAFEPAPNKTVDLGARGRLALKDSHLQAWDTTSRTWAPTEHGEITSLDHGLDGQAYVIQNGKLKSLDTKRESVVLPLGVPHELALTDKRTCIELGSAMDAPSHLRNFAVADAKHFITLGRNDALTAHVDGRQVLLPHPPGGGQIVNLALDHRQTLHALVSTSTGNQLYSLGRHQWQGLAPAREQWREVPLPRMAQEGRASLRTGASKQPELTVLREHDGQHHSNTQRLENGAWQRVTPPSEEGPSPVPDNGLHERLATRHQSRQALGGNLDGTSNVLGQSTEGAWQRQRDVLGSLRAHWHPVEGLSNAAKSIQHRYRGRDGLQDLYAEEQRLMAQLPTLATAQEPAHALDQRLEGGRHDDPSSKLAAAIGKWGGELEDHSAGLARQLGQTHRVLDDQGLPRAGYRPRLKTRDDLTGRLAKRLSGGGNQAVLGQLAEAFRRAPGRSEGKAERQLRELETLGLKLDYTPAGKRRRDVNDKGALLRDGLVLNAEVLKELHGLTDELEALRRSERPGDEDASNHEASLRDLTQRFDALRQRYEENPVQHYGQTHASGHRQLEALYDSHGRLQRELGSERQALGRLTRQALDVQRTPTDQALATQLRGLESGSTLDLSQATSVDGATPFFFAGPLVYLQGGGGQEKSRSLSLARTDEGLNVQLGGKTARNLNFTAGAGPVLPIAKGPHYQVGAFAGGEATLTGARTQGTSLGFKVGEGDVERMARHLTNRDAKLRELLDIGREFKTTSSTKTTVDLDLWGGADVRINVGQNKPDPVTSWFRASLGVGATANALHYERTRDQAAGPSGERSSTQGDNLQALRKVTAELPRLRPAQVLVGANGLANRTAVEISSKIHLDRARTRSFNVKFTPAKPVETREVDALLTALQQEFPAARGQLRNIRGQHQEPPACLAALDNWQRRLPRNDRRTDRQHAVLDSLAGLGRRQRAAAEGRRQFSAAETSVALPSERGWLAPPAQPRGLFTRRREAAQQPWLKELAPANATAIRDVLNQDPRFARLVAALEAKGTAAKVVLELKDGPRQRLEELCARGENVEHALRAELAKPENLRIKSLSVDHKVTRSTAFATPPLLLSVSSSAAVSHTRKQGTIEFQYGTDQDRPLTMSLDGELAQHGVGTDLRQRLAQEGTRLHYIGQGRVPTPTADEGTALSTVAEASSEARTLAQSGNRGGGH